MEGEAAVVIRPLSSLDDYRECVQLQEETWGHGFSERVPMAILKVSQRLGGVVAGAYDWDARLVGFVFGMTGWEDGRPVHWSDMLAVRPDMQGSGVGRMLKEHQRQQLTAQGVELMYWTFEPLESRNAHLNLARLGAVVREYARDMYGDTDSPLHQGIGTDRLIARWEMTSDRVQHRLATGGPGVTTLPAATERALDVADPSAEITAPGDPKLNLTAPWVAVSIPDAIQKAKELSQELAASWRYTTRTTLTHYLDRGYEVRELVREGSYSSYLLAHPSTSVDQGTNL
jgi:predicted GNAT superfamily acetyltransferase